MKQSRGNTWILLSILLHVLVIGAVLYTPLREALIDQFTVPEESEAEERDKEDPEKVDKIKESIVESKKRALIARLDELYGLDADLLEWRGKKLKQWRAFKTTTGERFRSFVEDTPEAPGPFPEERVQTMKVTGIYRAAIEKEAQHGSQIHVLRGLDFGMRFDMDLDEALETTDVQRQKIDPQLAGEMEDALGSVETMEGVEQFAEIADKAIREIDMAIRRVEDYLRELRERDLATDEERLADLAPVTLEEMEMPEIDPEELLGLTPEELAELAAAELAQLTPEELAALTDAQLAALTDEQLAALSLDQLDALSADQIAELNAEAMEALSPAQLAQLASQEGLSAEQRQMLQAQMAQSIQQSERAGEGEAMPFTGEPGESEGPELPPGQGDGQTLAEIMAGMSPGQRQALMEGAAMQSQNPENVSDVSQLMRAAAHGGGSMEVEGDDSDMSRFNVGQYPIFPGDYAVPPESLELIPKEVVQANTVPARRIVAGDSQSDRRGIVYVDSWYMIGPFENDGRLNFKRQYPPSTEFDLDAEYTGKFDQPVRWNFVQTDEIKQPVYPLADRAAYFAYTELYFEEPTEVWVAFGSDDAAKFWINEVPVFESRQKGHGWMMFEGHRKVFFKKGRNEIKARVETSPGVSHLSMILLPITQKPSAEDDS